MPSTFSRAVCGIVGGAMGLVLDRFPPIVRIETTNACNGRCTVCPHRMMQRPIGRMDDGLFAGIIDECARGGCGEVQLHHFGEPLLDDRLDLRIRYAKRQGIRKVKIFSNASLLDERWALRLLDAGLDEIKVSVDGATPEEFERIRAPLKYDQVMGNIRRLVALRDQRRSRLKIRVACCTTSNRRSTAQMVLTLADQVAFGRIHNWAGRLSTPAHGSVRKPCSRLWRTFTVLVSGEVALCCLDHDGRHVLGRVGADGSLADIWHSAAYAEVRRRHVEARQGEIDLCRDCSKAHL